MANPQTEHPSDESEMSRWLMRTDRPVRAQTCLALCLTAYAAACTFWRYAASGHWLDFRPSVFYEDLTAPLGEVFRHPLDVLTYPWMILVLGLSLGLLVVIPLLLSLLYRPAVGSWAVLGLFLLGHMPVLALAVGVGCALAGRAHFRRESPSLALGLGLLPGMAYFALSGMAGMDASVVLPLQRWALYAPPLVAALCAALVGSLALGLARLSGYRTVAVIPLLTSLLAGPATLFYFEIGPDELAYAVTISRLQPSGTIFDDEALELWSRRHDTKGLSRQALTERVREDLRTRRDELARRCEDFADRFPESIRKPDMLWLRAHAMSLQIDEQALATGLIRYSPSFVLSQAEEAWRRLLVECPASDQAALAHRALGELALRRIARGADADAQTRLADEHFHQALTALGPIVADRDEPAERTPREMFFSPPRTPNLDHYRGALEAVNQLDWLMRSNGVLEDPAAAEAMGAYLDINPRLPDYYKRLSALLDDPDRPREKTRFGDNIKLAIALQTSDVYVRAPMLMALAADERTDAAIAANFELGKLALRTAEAPSIGIVVKGLKPPEEYFRIVIAAPQNPFQAQAAEFFASLRSADAGR